MAVCNLSFQTSDGRKIELRDTAGQERFQSMVPLYLRSVDTVLLCFNPIKQNWLEDAKTYATIARNTLENVSMIAVATHQDLWDDEHVDEEKIEEAVKKQLGIEVFYATSAQTGHQVNRVKLALAEPVVNRPVQSQPTRAQRKEGCC
jgi:Ras-related protein Rab-5C